MRIQESEFTWIIDTQNAEINSKEIFYKFLKEPGYKRNIYVW